MARLQTTKSRCVAPLLHAALLHSEFRNYRITHPALPILRPLLPPPPRPSSLETGAVRSSSRRTRSALSGPQSMPSPTASPPPPSTRASPRLLHRALLPPLPIFAAAESTARSPPPARTPAEKLPPSPPPRPSSP